MKVMKLHGLADGRATTVDGLYVHHCDVDVNDGRGQIWACGIDGAMRFADAGEALLYWKRQSSVLPLRPWDGKPNRPMTAWTIEIVDAPSDESSDRPLKLIKAAPIV